ncbi:MAG: hypothetical protein IT289_03085 [Oligoflexia bacterium]|nr:hypothetical protein [Oligoflexia bacterium]
MSQNESGQVLVTGILIVLTLVLALGVLAHGSILAVFIKKLTSQCDKRVIEFLVIKANGYQQLAELNPQARELIVERRRAERALLTAPPGTPQFHALIALRESLLLRSRTLSLKQLEIKTRIRNLERAHMRKSWPKNTSKYVKSWEWIQAPLGLSTSPEFGFNGEVGPPQKVNANIETSHHSQLLVHVSGTRLLGPWANGSHELRIQDWVMKCTAKLEIQRIEGPWVSQIAN